MAAEENKVLYRRVIEEIWNQGKLSLVDELFSPDVVLHQSAMPGGAMRGLEAVRRTISSTRAAFPDLHLTIEDQIAEGDRVVTRFTTRGTQLGELQGIPPTGKQVATTAIIINRWKDGKIVENWISSDNLEMLQQLGVVPRMAPSGV